MNSKNIILVTLVGFFAFLIVVMALPRMGASDNYGGDYEVSIKEYEIYGEDGTILPVDVFTPEDYKYTKAVIMAADRGLDRNWNSKGMTMFSGEYMADALASNGIAVIRYDQRGTGNSLISGRNVPDMGNLSADFSSINKWAVNNLDADEIVLLGHGESCITALYASERNSLKPESILLINCAYSGTLLHNWGERLMHNMERAGVSAEHLAFARKELADWEVNHSFNTTVKLAGEKSAIEKNESAPEDESSKTTKLHPDLIAFYRALEYMDSAEMASWSQKAQEIEFNSLLKKALSRGINVYSIIGGADDETPQNEVDTAVQLSTAINAGNTKASYHVKIVKGVDHFLQEKGIRSQTDMSAAFHRMNPFRSYSKDFIKEVLSAIQ